MDKYEVEKIMHQMKDDCASINKSLKRLERSERAVEYMRSLLNGCLCGRRHLRDELDWRD